VNEFVELVQKMVPLIVSVLVPVTGIIIKLRNDKQDPSAIRRMKQHTKLHESLPDEAKPAIAQLIATEASIYAKDRLRKASRTINTNTAIGFIAFALLVAGGLYGLILLGTVWWVGYIVAVVWGSLGLLILLAGSFQLFSYEEVELKTTEQPAKAAA
jgi:hypothetical protein